jgi:hypothetical protein
MAGHYKSLKRKVDGVVNHITDDFSDFSLSSPATKIRRLVRTFYSLYLSLFLFLFAIVSFFVINFSIVPIRMLNYLRLWKKMMKHFMLLTTKELSFSSSQLFILLPLSLSLLILISSLKSRIVSILP